MLIGQLYWQSMETIIMKNKSALVIGASGMVGTALMKVLGRSKKYFLINMT